MNKVEKVFFENVGNEKTVLDMKIFRPEQTYVLNGAGVNLDRFCFTDYPEDNGNISFLFFARIMKDNCLLSKILQKLAGIEIIRQYEQI